MLSNLQVSEVPQVSFSTLQYVLYKRLNSFNVGYLRHRLLKAKSCLCSSPTGFSCLLVHINAYHSQRKNFSLLFLSWFQLWFSGLVKWIVMHKKLYWEVTFCTASGQIDLSLNKSWLCSSPVRLQLVVRTDCMSLRGQDERDFPSHFLLGCTIVKTKKWF